MWIEHVPTSKKCVAPLFWSSSASFDLNLLTLGPSIPKASNKLRSNPRSRTNSKKWSTRSSAVQWPTNWDPQYDVTIWRNFFEKKLTYPSYYFFTWEVVVSSNLKEYAVFCTSVINSSLTKGAILNWTIYLDFVSSWEYFAAICESGNIFLNLSLSPFAKENEWFLSIMFSYSLEDFCIQNLVFRCRFGTSCLRTSTGFKRALWSHLLLIFNLDCSFGVLIHVRNTTIPNAERLWTMGTSGRVYTIFVFTNTCILLTPTCIERRFSFTHSYQLYSERSGITG